MFPLQILFVLLPVVIPIDNDDENVNAGSTLDLGNRPKTISVDKKMEEVDLSFSANLHRHRKFMSDEIITRILLRSSVITLARFICVSKQWNHFIRNEPYFRRLYKQSPLMLGVFHHHKVTRSIKFIPTSAEGKLVKKNILTATSFNESLHFVGNHSKKLHLLASSNGILLLCSESRVIPSCYYICNPITKEWFSLPTPTNNRVLTTGFIYNDFNQYKVIRNIWTEELATTRNHAIEIFEREIFDDAPWKEYTLTSSIRFHISVDSLAIISEKTSLVYWPVYTYTKPYGCACDAVVAFDPVKGKLGHQQVRVAVIQLPGGMGEEYQGWKISQVNGMIVYAKNNTHIIKMWVLNEETQIWSLKYKVENTNEHFISVKDFHPLYPYLLLMRLKNKKMVWYNLQSKNEESSLPLKDCGRSAKLLPYVWPKWPPHFLLFEPRVLRRKAKRAVRNIEMKYGPSCRGSSSYPFS